MAKIVQSSQTTRMAKLASIMSGLGIATLGRFAIVGVCATLLHAVMLNVLVLSAHIHPTPANIGAFLFAFMVSYLGHYYFSFKSKADHATAAQRYFFMALFGLAMNTLLFAIIVNAMGLHYMVAFAAVVILLPPANFIISRRFVFSGAAQPVRRRRLIAHYGVPALFIVITLIYVTLFHFKAPFHDQWSAIAFMRHIEEGGGGFERAFDMHGAHWRATAYIILYGLAEATAMNHLYEGLTNVAVGTIGFMGMARLTTRAAKEYAVEHWRPALLAVCAAFWFSLDQASNWLWGWQVAVFINTAGAIWCIALLSDPALNWSRFCIAAAAAGAAVLSFATGLALAPIGAMIIAYGCLTAPQGARTKSAAFLLIWCVLSACLAFAYWRFAFVENSYARDVAGSGAHDGSLLIYVEYAVNYLSVGLTKFATALAGPIFAVGAALAAFATYQACQGRSLWSVNSSAIAFLSMMAYAIGAAALTAVGRAAAFGPGQAFVGRYISFSNFFWLALILFVFIVVANRRPPISLRKPSVAVSLVLVLCLLKIGNIVSSGKKWAERETLHAQAISAFANDWPDVPPATREFFIPRNFDATDDLAYLRARRLSFFRQSPPPSPAAPATTE